MSLICEYMNIFSTFFNIISLYSSIRNYSKSRYSLQQTNVGFCLKTKPKSVIRQIIYDKVLLKKVNRGSSTLNT